MNQYHYKKSSGLRWELHNGLIILKMYPSVFN